MDLDDEIALLRIRVGQGPVLCITIQELKGKLWWREMHEPFEFNLIFAFLDFETVLPEINWMVLGQLIAPH